MAETKWNNKLEGNSLVGSLLKVLVSIYDNPKASSTTSIFLFLLVYL